MGIITDKLALLEITEFSRVINLFSLTVIWMRTAIVWVIRLFACDFVVLTCFYAETWTDFVVHVLSLWFTSWLDCAAIGILSGRTAYFSFSVTITFADNWTQFPIVTGYWALVDKKKNYMISWALGKT